MFSSGTTTAFTLSLSALPAGPLATVVLYLTEGELAQLLRTEKAILTSELESDEFWRERCCSTFGQHMQHVQVRQFTAVIDLHAQCHHAYLMVLNRKVRCNRALCPYLFSSGLRDGGEDGVDRSCGTQ